MRIEGIQPNKGAPGEKPGGAKAPSQAAGQSFGAALEKAAAALSKNPKAPAVPDPGAPAAPMPGIAADLPGAQAQRPAALPGEVAAESSVPAGEAAPQPADHLEMIRFRMKTGYYNSKSLDDALTDKLTGFFDDLT